MKNKSVMKNAASLAVFALALTACSGGGGGAQDDGPAAEEGGTLTFANWQWLEPGRGEDILAAVKQYETVNPAATIETQEITRADYEKTVSTQIGSGGGPDIMIIPDPFFPELAASGALEPLDGILDPESEEALRPSNETYQFEGEQLGLVWEAVPYALFYNDTIMSEAGVEPPGTAEELASAAKTIQDETGKTGFVVRHQLNEEAPWWTDYSNWVYGFGGAWSDGENLTINSEENVAAADAYLNAYNSGGFGVGDDASTYRSKFAAGEVGMVIDNSSALLTMVSGDGVESSEVSASTLPFPGGGSAYAGFAIGINANSDNKELAKDFIKWMMTADAQSTFVEALFPSGIATDVEAPAELVEANPWIEAFYEQLDNSSSVVIPGFETQTPQVRTIVLTQVERMLTTGISAQEAMDAAQQQAENLAP
ncbi:sugar ABC transporter substrate-binding protein [Arthrobacter sp.]|uniref:ABC transporter substrate-binding protein n=1 Tax=Arthrobacter sp. TaxID=1667 RepID=UPI0028123E27|nr:sugar ABC transporter substrate-binding protein [Arthrobacter sp.]